MRTKGHSLLALLGLFVFLAGCGRRVPATDPVIVPPRFNRQLLDILVCPDNLTPLHLARRSEIEAANARIAAGILKRWNGTPAKTPVEALLVRADGKIAYEIRDGAAIMLIDQALVLDDSVGPPDPARSRRK